MRISKEVIGALICIQCNEKKQIKFFKPQLYDKKKYKTTGG